MSGEQRKSFRILTPLGHELAELTIGWRKYQVRVVDESLGGYAVSCEKPLKAAVGDKLTLRTFTALQRVQVVRLERFSDGMILGLHRLEEICQKPEQTVGLGWLALAAVTGMLLVVAWKPYLRPQHFRWEMPRLELPAWTTVGSEPAPLGAATTPDRGGEREASKSR